MDEWRKLFLGKQPRSLYVSLALVAYIWGAAFYALPLRHKNFWFMGHIWPGDWVSNSIFGFAAFLFLIWLVMDHEQGGHISAKFIVTLFTLTTGLYLLSYFAG